MLKNIFLFETKRWFSNWSFYIYLALFFTLSFFVMAASVGYFDFLGVTTASNTYANSPMAINSTINGLSQLVYFIVPTIIGATVYRDFKYNVHTILFSYPFNKFDYLVGKFLSGFVVTILITMSIGFAFLLATILPFANPELIGPIRIGAYFESYILFVIPNIFFIGTILFALVTLARNVSVGVIFVFVLFVIQSLIGNLTVDMDDKFVPALLDPFGNLALDYVTKYWTIDEQNTNNIPFSAVIIYNRLIWIGFSLLVFLGLYFTFSFSQAPISFSRKKKGARFVKNNFGSIMKLNLPKVSYNYSFGQNLKTTWNISKFEFNSIIKNWIFITIVAIMLVFVLVSGVTLGQELYGTKTYPVTWKVLELISGTFSFFIAILIYLFSGILIQNGVTSRMNLLVDSTPIPNWALFTSKVIALIKMTVLLLFVGMLSCILVQVYYGYYNFELGIYLESLFVFELIDYIIIILFSLFVQSLFKNYLAGFFAILVFMIAKPFLFKLGIEQQIFSFNSGGVDSYSDMNGFGTLRTFFIYKAYWFLFTLILSGITILLWRRGIVSSAKERLTIAKKRFNFKIAIPMLVFLIGFVGIGYAIYWHNNIMEPYYSAKEMELQQVDFEKKYKKFEKIAQPRITDVNVDMNIFPYENNYDATVKYIVENKSDKPIDSLFINYGKNLKYIKFSKANTLVSKDTLYDFNIYKLTQALQPGETMQVEFKVQNKPNTFLSVRSGIVENGTFINNGIFPSFGYSDGFEIADNDIRKKYGLPDKERMPETDDMEARMNTYISSEADWINFETTVSTAADQIAIAPGYLQKEWEENGRKYYHYKMDQKMLNFYAFNSGRYEVRKENKDGINFEIYYHKGHEYNVERMMDAMQKSIKYYSENFSPYQHKQARIIEFPRTMGTFAQAFANTMPFSEGIGFIADVDEENPNAVDYPFSVVSHEMAHQWWAHQVIGASVKGATLMSESVSEYSSLMVLRQRYGKDQMRKFLKDALDGYLKGRTFEWKSENPLMYNENQQYIHYNKGSLVLYAMSDYIGEKNFNNALKEYVSAVAFQEAPYTNSIEFVSYIEKATPDSLKYLIKDMFETITLYDNKVNKVTSKKLANGNYLVEIDFNVAKYRADKDGKKVYKDENGKTLVFGTGKNKVESLPLQDYVEIGIFGEPKKQGKFELENELFAKKYKIDKINNKVQIEVKEKPIEVGVDPYNKLIDTDSNDNRKKL